MSETWKVLPVYPDKYEVSSLGNVRSITREVNSKNGPRRMKGKLLKQQLNHKGYAIIGLSTGSSVKTYTVHQLVAITFFQDFIKGTELNHIDGNKLNNTVSNLEESTPSHNQLHAVREGLKVKQGKSKFNNVTYVKNPKAVNRWAASIRHNGKSTYGWKTFYTEEEAAHHVDAILDSIKDTSRTRNFP